MNFLLDLVLGPPLFVFLYGIYWIGACTFCLYPRRADAHPLVQVMFAILALLPAIFLIGFLTEFSADLDHPVSGWVGMIVIVLFLAHPWVYATHKNAWNVVNRVLVFPAERPDPSAAMSTTHHNILRAVCLAIVLACVTQVNLTPFMERAEGTITSRFPYQTRRGVQRMNFTIAFTDGKGARHYFKDTTQYIPPWSKSPIGVFYNPANPARDPLPDLGGWEQADNLKMLLIMVFFGRIGLTGLAPDRTARTQPETRTPAGRPNKQSAVASASRGPRPPKTKAAAGKKSKPALTRILDAVRNEMRQAILGLGYSCDQLFYAGAYDISPHHLFYGVGVKTDAERDRMNADPKIDNTLRSLLRKHGYPSHAIPEIGVRTESQETVDRDWGGEWRRIWQ